MSPSWADAARALDRWLADRNYEGADPHDFLASPALSALTLGNRWAGVAMIQLGRRLPVDLRGILGVRTGPNPKALALALAAHARLFAATGDEQHRRSARTLVERLAQARTADSGGWGYPFPWSNRDFHVEARVPSGVVTSFAIESLIDASETFGFAHAEDLAQRGARFLISDLNRSAGAGHTFCFSYTPQDHRCVHNANVLVAAAIARAGALTGDSRMLDTAARAAEFTVAAQRADGSWPYGTRRRDGWVDSFHTSYTLVALRQLNARLGTHQFEAAVVDGLALWSMQFVRGPAIAWSAKSIFPIDMHAVAHSIITLLTFQDLLSDARATAERLARWSMEEMRSASGYFYYRMYRTHRNRVAYVRWVQAWMLRALSELALVQTGRSLTPRGGV